MAKRRDFGGEPDHRVLILGGGFGGIYTALGLEHALKPGDRTEVTLVNAENFFLFTPMLCEIASSSIETSHAINPIRRMFKRTRFLEGEATAIDLEARTVTVRHPNEREYDYPYDHLVVALGARTGFFGMSDVRENALTIKTLGDALYLRNWAIQMLETADAERDAAVRRELLTFVVGGGGFTGVEIAGELNDLVRSVLPSYPSITQRELRVILVEAKDRLLPEFDEKLAGFAGDELRARGVEVRTGTAVAGASPHEVRIKDGAPIPTRTLVWASGVAPNPLLAQTALPTDKKGWITVDAHMRVPGLPGVWALGDCARIPDVLRPGHFQPALAQHAIREGDQLARNIAAAIRGQPTQPFRYRTLGQMATLGHHQGIGTVGPFKVAGFPAWALWRTYYLWRLPRLEKQLRVATDWTVDLFFGRDISQIQTYTASRAATRHEEERAKEQLHSDLTPAGAASGRPGGASG